MAYVQWTWYPRVLGGLCGTGAVGRGGGLLLWEPRVQRYWLCWERPKEADSCAGRSELGPEAGSGKSGCRCGEGRALSKQTVQNGDWIMVEGSG